MPRAEFSASPVVIFKPVPPDGQRAYVRLPESTVVNSISFNGVLAFPPKPRLSPTSGTACIFTVNHVPIVINPTPKTKAHLTRATFFCSGALAGRVMSMAVGTFIEVSAVFGPYRPGGLNSCPIAVKVRVITDLASLIRLDDATLLEVATAPRLTQSQLYPQPAKPYANKLRLSPRVIRNIVLRYDKGGASVAWLAHHYSKSPLAIRMMLIKAGVYRQKAKGEKGATRDMRALRDGGGVSLPELVRKQKEMGEGMEGVGR